MYLKIALVAILVVVGAAVGWGYWQIENYEGIRSTHEVVIDSDSSEVWDHLLDPEKRPVWVKGLIKIVPLSGERGTAGSRSLLLMLSDGRRFELEEEVIGIEDSIWLGLQTDSLDAVLTTTFTLRRVDGERAGKTLLTFEQDTYHKTRLGKLIAPFIRITSEQRAEADLAKLKDFIENGMSRG